MTRRRRWLLAMLAVVLVLGAATSITLVLRPCETRTIVLLNASRWAAQVTLQIEISEGRYTVWSGTVEEYVPPLRIPVDAPSWGGTYWVAVHFPETGKSMPEVEFDYTTPFLSTVEFVLVRDEDIVRTYWNDPPSGIWDLGRQVISCLDGS